MRKRLAVLAAWGWNAVCAAKCVAPLGLALAMGAAAFAAQADIGRGLAWLQAQVQPQGTLAVESKVAERGQAACEAAHTVLKLAGNNAQVSALLAAMQQATTDSATESLACVQQLRQQLGQTILSSDVEARRIGQQGYAPMDVFGVATALDTGWALAAQLRNLGAGDRASALAWLQANQASDGSFSAAGVANVLATAVILRALNAQAATDPAAAAIASKAAAWLLARQSGGNWLADLATTSVAFEAVQPYTGANPSIASSVNAYLLSQQLADGSWAGDPYITAVALRALALTTAIPVDPTVSGTTAAVRGLVTAAGTGQALSGVTVTVTESGGSSKTALSDIGGQFLIQGIAPGPATVAASLAGFQTATGAASLVTGTTAVFSPTLYTNGSVIDAGGHVSGTLVAFGSNTALAAVAVQAMPTSGPAVSGVTDASGHFDIAIPSGSAVLSFSLTGYADSTQLVIVASGSSVNLGMVPLQTARQSSTLRGTVHDFNGQPIAGATVQVGAQSIATNSAGAYSLVGLYGTTFTELVSAAGYVTQSFVISTPLPGDLVQDVSLPAVGAGYLTLTDLQPSPISAGLRQDITATVRVTNGSPQPVSEGLALDVISPTGEIITTLAATDSAGNPIPISLNSGEATTAYFKWNSGSFPAGDYQLIAKLYVPGTATQQNPSGVVVGSARSAIAVQTSAHFTGSVTANPPVMQAGANQPVALSALIQNDGNTQLPAQSYLLVVVDTATGATMHTQAVNADAISVSQLRTLGFATWTPSAGGNFSVRVTASSTPGSQISTSLYVGAAGQAAFVVDKPVVPSGTQTVRGTVNVTGQNSVYGTIQDPLAPLVKQALVKAVNYGDTYSFNHYNTKTKCYACHVQAQSLAGGEHSRKYSPPVSELVRAALASGISQHIFNPNDTSIGATGPTSDAAVLLDTNTPSVYRLAGTTLGFWGLSQWHDLTAVNYTRGRLARYVMGKQSSDGSWLPDQIDNWWSTKAPLTALNVGSLASVKRELVKQPSTFTGKTLVNVPASGLPSSTWRLAADASGNLYAASDNYGVWKVPPDGGSATRVSTIGANVVLPLPDGRLLIGATGGLYRRELNGVITTVGAGWPVSDITSLPDGNFLMTTPWWDPATNLYKVTAAGGITAFAPSSLIPGKSGTTVMPDGSIVAVNGLNRNLIRFNPNGQLRDIPVPVFNTAQPIAVRPYNGGVIMGTERGLYFYDQNWIGQRWTHEWAYGPASTPDGRLFVNAAGGIYEVKDKPIDSISLSAQIDASMDKAATWLKAGAGIDQSSNVDLAFQLMGLGDAKKYFQGTSRASEFDDQMQSIGAILRSRQDGHGGWVWRQSTETSTNPMVTAMVGVALDTLNPSPNSPAVRSAVEFLLKAQQADGTWTKAQRPDGTWTPLGYATPLIPTTWVEIWLPLMLDRLGYMDSTLSVTFPPNVSMSNPTVMPTSTAAGPDAGTTYEWNFTTTSDAPAQVAFDLTLADMQADEIRPVAQQASLLFKNSFTVETVTEAVVIPTVAVTTSLTETVTTDRPIYTDTDQATFTASVSNGAAEPRSAQVRFSVLDAAGMVVQTLPSQPVTVAGGETITAMATWAASAALAGTYQVRADLVSPAGLTYASATASFSVTASQQQTSGTRILTDRLGYSPAQLVQITGVVVNQTSNTLLQNVRATITVTSADGSRVFTQTEEITQLAPGTQRQYSYGIAASGLPAGNYTATLQLLSSSGGVLSQSAANFTVLGTDQSGVGLTGTMQASPAVALIGQPVTLNLDATNNGNTGLNSVPITVRVIEPVSGSVLTSFAQTVASWPQGTSRALSWTWTAQGLDGQTLVAVASAHIGGQDIVLGQAKIRLVGVPRLNAEPAQLAFPVVYVGEAASSQGVVLTSVGSTTATSVTFALAGADASQFAIPQGGCTQQGSFPVGAACTFTVSYRPSEAGDHSAQVRVAYVGGADVEIRLSGQSRPIVFAGSVTPEPAEIHLGETSGLAWSVSNPASASATAQLSLRLLDSAQQALASWPIPAALDPGASLAGNQSYTASGVAQTLTAVLSQLHGTASSVLSTATLVVKEVPIKLGGPVRTKGEARILVLASCPQAESNLDLDNPDPSVAEIEEGEPQNDIAGCVQQRGQAIAAYLDRLGIVNKVVTTPERFQEEMRCGIYNTYWLSGGAAKLDRLLVRELREAVWKGEGLIVDGEHDARNHLLHPIAGVKYQGKLPYSDIAASIDAPSIYTAGAWPTLGQAGRFELLTGQSQGLFTQVPGNQGAIPAIVTNRYGSGNSLLFAFNLAAMLAADPEALDARLRDIVLASAANVGGNAAVLTVGDASALALTLNNQGSVAASAQVVATLPAGLAYSGSNLAPSSVSGNTVTWAIQIPAQASQQLVLRVRADQSGDFAIPVTLSSLNPSGQVTGALETANLSVSVAPATGLLQAPTSAVQQIAATTSSDQAAKSKAAKAVADAQAALAQGDLQQALAQWVGAGDALLSIANADTRAARDTVALALEASQDAICHVVACIAGSLVTSPSLALGDPLAQSAAASNTCSAPIAPVSLSAMVTNRRTGLAASTAAQSLVLGTGPSQTRQLAWQPQEGDVLLGDWLDSVLLAQWQGQFKQLGQAETQVGAPGTSCHEGWSLPAERFTPFAGEGLQAKGGKSGNSDWEWALGAGSSPSTLNFSWQSGKSYNWQLTIGSTGQGSFSVYDGAALVAQASYSNSASKLHLGRAIRLGVSAASDVDTARIAASLIALNGQAVSMSVTTDAPGQDRQAVLYLSSLASGLAAQGTLRLDFSGSSPPQGSKLLMRVQAGNASCQ